MLKSLTTLNAREAQKIESKHKLLHFPNDFILVYENQSPNAAIVLIEGTIELTKKAKIVENIKPLKIIGINNLLKSEPIPCCCRLIRDSKIILIGKSELLEAMDNPRSTLHFLVKEYATVN